jgi:hypothetical protein
MNNANLRLLAVCAALAGPALTSAPVLAQPAPVIDANTLARQRQLFAQGNQLYDQGRYADAEAAYIEAWKLKKSFDVAGNLGNLEADLKKWRPAAEYIAYAIREFPAGGKPGLRDELLRRLAEAKAQVGALRVQVNRPGAEVYVDGVSVGVTPLPDEVFVEPGNHLVEVRLEGLPPAQANVAATRGRTDDVVVNLAATGANRAIVIGGAVVAGVALITGGALLGVSAGKGSDANTFYAKAKAEGGCPPFNSAQTGDCATLKSDLSAKSTLGSAGVWLLVTGGVVGVATVVYAVAGGTRPSRSGFMVAPVVGAGGGGLVARGSF